MDLPTAFAIIRYLKVNDQSRWRLIQAIMPIHTILASMKKTHNSDQIDAFLTKSDDLVNTFLDKVRQALKPFRDTNWFGLINPKDPWWAVIRPYYEFYAPVVPDPANSINLFAFAFDTQSVHRASVQTVMEVSLGKLRAVPVPDDMNAVAEFFAVETDLISHLLMDDYESLIIPLTSGPVIYSDVFDHLWAYIRGHEHKEELVKRLSEEIRDGVGMCANGKLARLLNVVEGYMEGVSTTSQKELFQNRMAVVAKMEKSAQLEAATKAFQEFGIPEGERGPWLEALD
jgi:predicted house-cleaning noncanonical NTP pyrophosphatase (MazG superfamily)